ncbi:MAG TPA: ATP-binding protein [Thermoanaerobaculia bacterium]|nr:ATP-binding protein [Thermoanaerobaculia bacterium]
MRLRSHLLTLTLGTLLPMVILGVIATGLIAERERALFQRGATERMLALLTAVDAELSRHSSTLQALGSSRSFESGNRSAFREEALRALAIQPGWRAINLAESGGERIWDTRDLPPEVGATPVDDESFRAAAETGRVAIGNLHQEDGEYHFRVRVPITDDANRQYVLTARVDPRVISDLLARQRLPSDWVGVVLDANERIVARTVDQQRTIGRPASESLRAALAHDDEGWFHGATIEGSEVYTPFNRSPETGWTVAMGIPVAAVDTGPRRMAMALALGVIAALMLAGLLAAALGRRISAPISELATAARALGAGEPVIPAFAGPAPTSDVEEVNEVARALAEGGLAVRAREEELRSADRAKDEFLAMLGHELRNPLAALLSAAELLEATGPTEGPGAAAPRIVSRQVRHMTRMVDDLLDVSRVTTGKFELSRQPVDLAEVATTVVDSLDSAGALDDHQVNLDAGSVWVDADVTRLEQVLANLVGNALKYTPAGGRIEISTRREGERAMLVVSDSGIGLSPELLPRVFELFVQGERTLDRTLGGLGIGLTLVKRLVERHGGTVTAASAGEGHGSQFTVALPAIEAPVANEAAAGRLEAPAPSRRVLIVEDNEDARQALQEALRGQGHEVFEAADGPAALASIGATRPDVAVIDIGLPGLDGYEVARRLRAWSEGRSLGLIALTGYGQRETRERAIDAGFDSYLTKPVSPRELSAVIESVVSSSGVRPAVRLHHDAAGDTP